MDLDLNTLIDDLQMAARSVGAELTSPWFYLQLGLILAAAGLAFAAGAAMRARFKVNALGLGLPIPLRLFVRVLVGSAPTAVFAALMGIARLVTVSMTWPSRSYLLSVAANLALAWLIIRLVASGIRNEFVVHVVSISALVGGGAVVFGAVGS